MTNSSAPDRSVIKLATLNDLPFILSASKTAREQIGFVPSPKLAWLCERNQVALSVANGDLVGFVVHGRTAPLIKIWQIWMRPDARRIEYATQLVQHVVQTTTKHDAFAIQLRCATDLPALAFWESLGFSCQKRLKGGNKRSRTIAQMRRQLTTLQRLGLRRLSGPEQCPGGKARVQAHSKPARKKTKMRRRSASRAESRPPEIQLRAPALRFSPAPKEQP